MSIRRHVRRTVRLSLATVALFLVGVLGATAAVAANPYLSTPGASSTRLYYLPNTTASNWMNEPNGIRFQMECWLDNAGHRWFRGTAWNGDYGYATAATVQSQITVGRC